MADLAFILCTEAGRLEGLSTLLVDSLRTYGGGLAQAPVYSYTPRPGRPLSRATLRIFESLGVRHEAVPLNTAYTDYPLANKPLVAAHAETTVEADLLVLIDCDTVVLREPDALKLPDDTDAALCPVFVKNVGTDGSDPNHRYWQALDKLIGSNGSRRVTSIVDRKDLRAYWNSGVVPVRRNAGVFGQWAANFRRVMERGLRPGHGIYYVEQTVLTATLEAMAARVDPLPVTCNYPLFAHRKIPAAHRAPLESVAIAHYQQMFRRLRQLRPLDACVEDGLPLEKAAWLRERLKAHGVDANMLNQLLRRTLWRARGVLP